MWILSLFLALILVALAQVWVFKRFGFRKIEYRRWFSPNVINEGEQVEMFEVIKNEKLLPMPWVRIEAEISPNIVFSGEEGLDPKSRRFHRSVFSLSPYMNITRRHHISCGKRGYYHIPSVAMTTGDLLGIGKRQTIDIPTESVLTVFPTLLPMEELFADKNSFTGDTVVRRWIVEDPFMIKGVREYTSSDPYNRINWKATARTGTLQVHDFDYTADIKLMIVVNVDTDSNQWTVTMDENTTERALSLAATCAQYAIDNGMEVGFACNGRTTGEEPSYISTLEPRSGQEYLAEILTSIAKIQLTRSVNFHTLLQGLIRDGLENSDILLITAYVDQNIQEQIDHMRQNGNYVEILDPRAGAEQAV